MTWTASLTWQLIIFAATISVVPPTHGDLWSGKTKTERTIVLDVTVDASPGEVFDLWTTIDGVKNFFAPDARIDLVVGGAYTIIFNPQEDPEAERFGTKGARILALERGKSFSFEWKGKPGMHEMRADPLPTWVELSFESAPGQPNMTRVQFAHYGFGAGESWDEAFRYFGESAWPTVLRRLKEHCAKQSTDRPATASSPTSGALETASKGKEEKSKASEDRPTYYAALVSPGLNAKPFEQWGAELVKTHKQYMADLDAAGKLVLAGPFTDGAGGLTILRVESEEEARELMGAEPCVRAGIFNVTIHPWYVARGRLRD